MDFMQSIAKELKPSDIPELSKNGEPSLWRELAEKFGVGPVLLISQLAGGDEIYVPSFDALIRPAVTRLTRKGRK